MCQKDLALHGHIHELQNGGHHRGVVGLGGPAVQQVSQSTCMAVALTTSFNLPRIPAAWKKARS